jgi:two-component system cell cycle response regulator DivK
MDKRVMIFDDDADILEICRYILESMGLQVETRQNCKDVIEDIRSFRPHVVIMDNWIPDSGGVKATQLIKADAQLSGTPVILFTASKDVQALVKEAGADTYIEKPFNIQFLEQTVKGFL